MTQDVKQWLTGIPHATSDGSLQHAPAPQRVDGAAFSHGREPNTGNARNAAARPLRERDQKRLLRQLRRLVDVSGRTGKARNETRRSIRKTVSIAR